MTKSLLLIRADAGPGIGTGHVMRCLALAQAWQDAGGQAVFATTREVPAIEQRLASEGFQIERLSALPGSVEDASLTAALASRLDAAFVVVDGYCFDAEYQRSLKTAGHRIILIDDFGHSEHYCSDFVLDQNSGAREESYLHREPQTRLLLGPQYALLRREFRAWREWKRDFTSASPRLLITLGGADPGNLTLRILEALQRFPDQNLETTILVGPANSGYTEIEAAARANPSIRLLRNIANVPYEMARADIAVIAAGGTLWELLFMGNCVLSYSRNHIQAGVLSELAGTGTVNYLGPADDFDEERLMDEISRLANQPDCRRRMSAKARAVVDGIGVNRVHRVLAVDAPESIDAVRLVAVSPAEKDGFMRMASRHFCELNPAFTPHADWTDHYFESLQSNPNYCLRWMMNGNERAGFMLYGIESHRFLPRTTGMIYEVYVVPAHRRKGIARICARQAIAELRSFCPSKLQLETVDGNEKASALWQSMGFRRVSERFVLEDGRP